MWILQNSWCLKAQYRLNGRVTAKLELGIKDEKFNPKNKECFGKEGFQRKKMQMVLKL